MQKKGNAGQMRLQRESRMQKKDMDAQVKKTGKINDGFICLPDPEDAYKWWYVIFGLDMDPYRGGFYMGYITCPDDYPAKAPKINLITHNGRFRVNEQQDGICLSISHYHPESWNPAWKVNQIVIGLQTFWQGGEYTYGSTESHDYPRDIDIKERSYGFAIKSRKDVLEHPKFKEIFAPYADAIGINEEQNVPEWAGYLERQAKRDEAKRIADEKKAKAEEERKAKEVEEAAKKEQAAKKLAMKEYFRMIKEKNLTKYIGQPEHAKRAMNRLQA
jgi:ubiquitin-conjugating enzyme E2 J2